MTDTIFWLLAFLLMTIGIVGIVFPLLPGATFLFAGMWLAAWIEDYQRIGAGTIGFLFALMLLSFVVDWVASALGAKKVGASKAAIIGATLGSIFGVVAGLWGVLIFPFFGAVVGELIAHGDHNKAQQVGWATWIGTMIGLLTKIALAFTMIGVFVVAWFW